MKTTIVSAIIVLALVNLNSPTPILEPHRVAHSDSVVVSFMSEKKVEFPDRKVEYNKAKEADIEKARLEALRQAEAQRQAQLAEQAKVVPNTPQIAPQVVVSGGCADWIAQAGITDVASALILINRESGCRVNASNPSGAYGIPQALPGSKMASAGADWQTNPVTQLRWMQSYVIGRYGSWANAVAHSNSTGWY